MEDKISSVVFINNIIAQSSKVFRIRIKHTISLARFITAPTLI